MPRRSQRRPSLSDKLLARLQTTSRAAGAVCLDDVWQGGEHRYRFRCDKFGHEWTRPGNVQRGNPRCPHCARETPGPVERLAGATGVECLDTEWLGAEHRYRLRCTHGHEWRRRGDALQQNPLCPAALRVSPSAYRRQFHGA